MLIRSLAKMTADAVAAQLRRAVYVDCPNKRGTEPYRVAMEQLHGSPAAREALGEPQWQYSRVSLALTGATAEIPLVENAAARGGTSSRRHHRPE